MASIERMEGFERRVGAHSRGTSPAVFARIALNTVVVVAICCLK